MSKQYPGVNWEDEPVIVVYIGSTADPYYRKSEFDLVPATEENEAWAANEIAKYRARGGHRNGYYFIMPKTEAEALPARLSDPEIEARNMGLKNKAEYDAIKKTMIKYRKGVGTCTESRRIAYFRFMADLYDTYRDEVVDVGGTPSSPETFVTAITTSEDAWGKFTADAEPLYKQIQADRRKKKKAKRKKRLKNLVAVIAVVAGAVFLGPAIISGAQAAAGGISTAVSAVASIPATAASGITSALTAVGVPAGAASAISNSAIKLAAQGADKGKVAKAAADVALPYAQQTGTDQLTPAVSWQLSTPVIIGIAVGGLTVAGLIAWAVTRK